MKSRRHKEAPKLPRFKAPKRMTSVKFFSKKEKLMMKRNKKVCDEYEQDEQM